MRIKQLSPLLASQIAAGEVVERPASVLKELVENSLDAGSSKIEIIIETGGVKLIQVRDNGKGIYQEDLTLAFAQHATSKIAELTDLACINSLGFRGEAIASIAAVSEVVISSKPSTQAMACKMSNLDWLATPASHPDGTTIKVSNLFYNIPARRKFLRSERTEYVHLEEVFKRIALSHFEVGFSWSNNGKELYSLPACVSDSSQELRLAKIFGARMLAHAVYIDISQNGLRLWGWLGLPSDARATAELQFFYINKRIVRDRLINHAVKTGYQEYLTADRHATYCLYLEIDPASIDVNVHPTKHEIRFRDSRVVYAFLVSALQQSLAQTPVLPVEPVISAPAYMRNTAHEHAHTDKYAVYVGNVQPKSYSCEVVSDLGESNFAVTIEAILGNGRFILAEYLGLVLIDVVKAKILLYIDEVKAKSSSGAAAVAVTSLTPSPVMLMPSSTGMTNILNSIELFDTLGFTLTQFGNNEIVVNTVPKQLGTGEFITADFLVELAEVFAKHGFEISHLNSELDWLLKILLKHFKVSQPAVAGHELVAFVSKVAPFFRQFSLDELVAFAR